MANLTLELNIYSAKDLENVNLITKMDVYAVVWINGDYSQNNRKEKTAVDRTGGSELTWNHAVKFSIDQRLAYEGRLTLVVKLVCDRIFGGKDLGEVQVPVHKLLNSKYDQGMRFVTYQVRTSCGKGQGSLTFSYRFYSPSFNLDIPASLVYPNPIDTSPNFPSTTYPPPSESGFYPPRSEAGFYPPPPIVYPPSEAGFYPPSPPTVYPPSEAGFYPPPPPTVYPPSSQPQGYSAPPYPYPPNPYPPNPYPHQYDSPYAEHSVTAYPPTSSASNFYQPPSYVASPAHQPCVYPPPDKHSHSYHQTKPSQSFHEYAPPSPQKQHGYSYPTKKNKPELGSGLGVTAGLLGVTHSLQVLGNLG